MLTDGSKKLTLSRLRRGVGRQTKLDNQQPATRLVQGHSSGPQGHGLT